MNKRFMLAIAAALSATFLPGMLRPAAATPANSPFNIAVMADRGQIKEIQGYDTLHMNLMQNNITAEEIIKATGYEPTAQLSRDVRDFIHSFHQND